MYPAIPMLLSIQYSSFHSPFLLTLTPTPIPIILCMVKFSQASEAEAAQWLSVRLISVALNYIFFLFLFLCGNHISVSAYCTSVKQHCATNFGFFLKQSLNNFKYFISFSDLFKNIIKSIRNFSEIFLLLFINTVSKTFGFLNFEIV